MAKNVTIANTNYTNVPSIDIPLTQGSGNASFYDVSDTTAVAGDVATGKYFYTSSGVLTEGTNSGGGGTDVPTFTMSIDELTEEISLTCDKTYSELRDILGVNFAGIIIVPDEPPLTLGLNGYVNEDLEIVYRSYDSGMPYFEIVYMPNGTIIFNELPESLYSTLNVTENGTYTADWGTLYSEVNVNVQGSANLQTKSITPDESSHTVTPDSGYDGLSSVSVGAISSTYVGSGISRRTSSDLTASGATVTVPRGYYASQATKSIASGSASAPSSISGTTATVTTGTNTLTLTKTVSVTPTVSAGYVSSGTATNSSVSLTANVTTKGTATITPTTTNQTIASGTYITGTQTIAGDSDLVAGNIKSGVQIFGVTGTYEGSGGGSSKNVQVYRGYDTVNTTSYTATDVTLTVAKTGTYNVSWMGYRNRSSGTHGSQLYVNGTSRGSASTSFINTYGHYVSLTNQSFNQGDVLVVRARASGTSYYTGVGNLIIEEV